MAAVFAASPALAENPQSDLRVLLTRLFFGAAALLAGAAALLFGLLASEVGAGLRLAIVGSFLLLMVLCLAAGALISRVVARHVRDSAEREARFLGLLWIAADGYWEMDAAFNLTRLWEQRLGSHGYVPVTQGLGRPPWRMRRLQFDPDALDALRADLEAHRPFRDVHLRWRCRDSAPRYLLVSGEPRFDARRVFTGYWGVARDATADALAQQALQATETRYRALFNRMQTPLVLHRHGEVIEANPAALALFGGIDDTAGAEGQSIFSLCATGADLELARQRIAHLEQMQPGESLPPQELRLRTRDGRRLVVRATDVRVEAEGGPATLSMFLDDTERQSAEQAVRRSEALLSHLVATSPDVITLSELDSGRYTMVNDTFCRLTGYRVEEVIGRSSYELGIWARPEDRERIVSLLVEQGPLQNMPAEFITRDGRRLSLLVSAARFVMDGRDYLVINARDVSELERTRKEHEAILQNASIGIAFTRDRRFVQANARCEQMFGWPRGALIGQPGSVVWGSAAEYEALGREIGPLLAAGQQIETERLMVRRDGSQLMCRILAQAVDPAQPTKGGTIWILDDVTERRMMDQQLARARDDAEAASRAKSAFLANTSHELRTPLNGLVGLARLARQPDLVAAARRPDHAPLPVRAPTQAALHAVQRGLSKVEAGKLQLETVAFDLQALLQALQRAYGTLAHARALAFTLDIGPDVPRHVLGDPVRVRQILSNYLSNALKFTPHGAIRLVARQVTHGLLRFEVHDTGPGVSPKVQSRLFRPFTQADQSTTRRFGGTGLGLSICHELASLMGGSVGVQSPAPGRRSDTPLSGPGSCFWVELPLPATDARDVQSGLAPLEADNPIAGARVLMVEDNPVNMMIAVALLEQWGVKVTQASNGHQAIEAVDEAARKGRPFDAVLMDVQMPEMSGHEATRVLRQRYGRQQLPIIALTAAALVSERDEALQAGMNDFLTKPIDAQRLRRTLIRLLGDDGSAHGDTQP